MKSVVVVVGDDDIEEAGRLSTEFFQNYYLHDSNLEFGLKNGYGCCVLKNIRTRAGSATFSVLFTIPIMVCYSRVYLGYQEQSHCSAISGAKRSREARHTAYKCAPINS